VVGIGTGAIYFGFVRGRSPKVSNKPRPACNEPWGIRGKRKSQEIGGAFFLALFEGQIKVGF